MVKFKRAMAGGIVLSAVSGVSILIGGALVGSASADGEPSASATSVAGVPAVVTHFAFGGGDGAKPIAGEGTFCVTSAGGEDGALPPLPVPGVAGIVKSLPEGATSFEAGVRVEAPKDGTPRVFTTVMRPDGTVVSGELPATDLTIVPKPLTPEEIDQLVADGNLTIATPADCTVVEPGQLPPGFPTPPAATSTASDS